MKFQDIPAEPFSIRVKSTDGSSFEDRFAGSTPVLPVARIVPNEAPGTFDLALSDSIVSVTSVSEADAQRLNSELSTGRAMLAQLSDLAQDGSVELRIAFFAGYVAEMGDVEIGVDDYVETRYRKMYNRPSRDIYAWLAEQCTFKLGDQSYFFLTAGPAIEEELRPDSDDTGQTGTEGSGEASEEQDEADAELDEQPPLPEEGQPRTDQPTLRNSFCVTGSDILFVATTRSLPGGESIYVPSKLTVRKSGSDKAIRLAKGTLKFLDCARTGRIQLQAKAQLSALAADESSYLRKWDEFGDQEGEILLSKGRAIGALEFIQPTPELDGTVSVRIISDITPAALDALSNREIQLEVVDAVPEYIANPALSFTEFSQALLLKAKAEEPGAGGSAKNRDRGRYFEVERYDGETKTLTLKTENLPQVGTLVLSMAGELAQIKRRIEARTAIRQGRSANPQLGLLIEEKGEITSLRSPQKVKPLTRFVRQKVFRNPPTPMQERAIDVALNTPDIALIQGPPGTGKTTVIAAILERLNEIAAQSDANGPGQVLLSGFQHDAVENMIDRISLNGIPVPKFGRRSGAKEDDMNAFEKRLEDWCGEIAQQLRAKNPQITELEEERTIKDLYKQYIRTPTHKLAATLVERIAAVGVFVLGEDLSRRAVRLAKRLATEELLKADQNRHLLAVQRIRIRPESFADDGPERAEDALVDLVDLEDALDTEQSDLLEEASAWRHEKGTPPFLSELKELKRSLLVRLTAPPVFRVEKHSDEVLSLAEAAVKQIGAKGHSATDKKTAALAEFLAELENDPFGMIDAVSDFSYAFSATVQQSVNRGMLGRKGIRNGDGDESLEFEYAIIDEAARVSPRDLMIPMARGKKIILVGDHRQLPHIIDEEVAALMEEGKEGTDESDWLKKSMFEYLFSERLKALEEKDGILRRVTLDKQFRMHPQLGDFVSRNFYDLAEQFGSGLPESLFAHNLPGTDNKPAMWLNVPASAGHGRRSNTSWIRPAEAEAIAIQLRDWVESPEGSKLSYGVISFYKAQADLIGRDLERQLGPIAKQVRVGTVDSFQGMEFDVVFLSVVRTIPENWKPRDRDPAKQAQSLFGHLCLRNRLNVSMSRQKKLLVVVGDSALVTNDLADAFIRGLADFYKLTGGSRPTHMRGGPSPGPSGMYTGPSPVVPDVEEKKAPPLGEQPLINYYRFASQAGIDNPVFFSTMLHALGRDPGERYQTYEQWWKEVFPGTALRKPRSGGSG